MRRPRIIVHYVKMGIMKLMQAIIGQIEDARAKLGWSKLRASKEVGMTQAAYSNLVNGNTSDMRLSTLLAIAETFGCRIEINPGSPGRPVAKRNSGVQLEGRRKQK